MKVRKKSTTAQVNTRTLKSFVGSPEKGGKGGMAKYGKKSQEKVKEVMHEYKEGKLKIGKSGKKVTKRNQAVAIGLSEARKEGDKVPKKKS